ncbi:DNA polymerase III subunit gamma/tau [Croceivirga thetidis]|uniref:DNA polymerase III subunit gamma/tau n=1 Tax=Croceivirga thetidis TaxID=2721623 RepID=A0ABX1GPS1_9FLAO|nr:DNA polymerase III subunit gamma/tau [Croceivirga thetidis]NKI31936.1 DNA polymerase III subunit gamma/tau [Croceivirga thetidis]
MEPFVVSARKYRPQIFKDVVGQKAITDTLENAIASNHLAQALLFCGPRGVGKTTCARILAKKINQDGTEAENEDFAFNIFELDAASNNSVDDIRSLTDQVRIPPQVGNYKVYIIDEVHMLSQSAFNAFLKTLEEPPKHAIFILATTEKHKIIPTILSRCQIFDFKRITVKDAVEYLKYIANEQGVNAEEDALHIIAQKADGAMRDALSIFDRVVSFSGKELTRKAVAENLNVLDYDTYFEATDLILGGKIPELLLLLNKTLALGFDGHHFIVGLASHFRDLLVCQHPETVALLEVGDETKAKYAEQSNSASKDFLIQALDMANSCDLSYKNSKNQRLLVELTLMKVASLNFDNEKKKDDFIIPASYFRNQDYVKVPETKTYSIEEKVHEAAEKKGAAQNSIPESTQTIPEIEKVELKNMPSRVSGLSLSSLKAKKEHQSNKTPAVEANLPSNSFTHDELLLHWKDYAAKLDASGKKIMASNLLADEPKLKEESTIFIELPNGTMKKEIEREQGPLMAYLKGKLQNHSIELEIQVNEEVAKKFAFTPEEKYEKLREKNPAIDLLRQEFDLDF